MLLETEPPRHPSPFPPRATPRVPRVVVAEDDAEFRGMIAGVLRDDGYDVIEESDGGRLLVRIAAVYTLPVLPIDLIVSDVCMPVCSGLDILKAVRRAHWSTPVILMTGFGDGDLRSSAAHFGAALLEKPFEAATLTEKVRELLRSPRSDGSASTAAPH
jgi:DNA-binding response OmpR family regulator